jgi:hypothetical protein
MAENEPSRITARELRAAELRMTGRPPASAMGLIGFVPAAPASPVDTPQPPRRSGSSNGQGVVNTPSQAGKS